MKNLDYRTKLVIILLYSSTFLGKAYAYLGVALGVTFLIETKMFWGRWYDALTRRDEPAAPFAWALLISILYGVAQAIRGYFLEYSPQATLEDLGFSLYPTFFFAGIWAGARAPWIVPRYVRFMAWYMLVYAALYFVFFSHLNITLTGVLPGTGLDLLGRPRTGSVILLGLLACEPAIAQFWIPIVGLCILTIANQERGDWLGFAVALTIWGTLARKLSRVMMIGSAIVLILLVAYVADFRIPGFGDRGGVLSARDTIARMAGAVSPDLAEETGASAANSNFYYGTVYWRKRWWAKIEDEVSKNVSTMVFGLGYGYPLANLAGPQVAATGTRSPHNVFYFAYAYSGLVGVAIFFALQLSLFRLIWRSYKLTGETYGLIFYCYELIMSFFGNFLETPQAGIYMYLFLGLMLGPALSRMESRAHMRVAYVPRRRAVGVTAALRSSQEM